MFRTLFLIVLLTLAALLFYGWHEFNQFSASPLQVSHQKTTIDIARGSSFKNIVATLREQGLTHADPLYWRVLAEQMHVADRLHAGEYAVPVGTTPRQLLAAMAAGKVVQHDFTIVDGWTFAELRLALARVKGLEQETAGMDGAQIMQPDRCRGRESGRPVFAGDLCLGARATAIWISSSAPITAMSKILQTLWAGRAKDLPLDTPYEALILASIVEKETGRADERARIAGVFIRRLRDHMLLQTDPSVIYGMGASYNGNIRKSDLHHRYALQHLHPPGSAAHPDRLARQAGPAGRPASGRWHGPVLRGQGRWHACVRRHPRRAESQRGLLPAEALSMSAARGKFVTLEGGEGAGKSTLLAGLHAHLENRGLVVVRTREPGGTALGEAVRAIVLDPQLAGMTAEAELLLMFASRAQLVRELIQPSLAAGRWVLCDRFADASHAYQGAGRGQPAARIDELERWACDGLRPDLTLLLDLPVETGRERARHRGAADRIESEADAFFERVRECYRQRAAREPARFRLLDATRSRGGVLEQATRAVDELLARPPA